MDVSYSLKTKTLAAPLVIGFMILSEFPLISKERLGSLSASEGSTGFPNVKVRREVGDEQDFFLSE